MMPSKTRMTLRPVALAFSGLLMGTGCVGDFGGYEPGDEFVEEESGETVANLRSGLWKVARLEKVNGVGNATFRGNRVTAGSYGTKFYVKHPSRAVLDGPTVGVAYRWSAGDAGVYCRIRDKKTTETLLLQAQKHGTSEQMYVSWYAGPFRSDLGTSTGNFGFSGEQGDIFVIQREGTSWSFVTMNDRFRLKHRKIIPHPHHPGAEYEIRCSIQNTGRGVRGGTWDRFLVGAAG